MRALETLIMSIRVCFIFLYEKIDYSKELGYFNELYQLIFIV